MCFIAVIIRPGRVTEDGIEEHNIAAQIGSGIRSNWIITSFSCFFFFFQIINRLASHLQNHLPREAKVKIHNIAIEYVKCQVCYRFTRVLFLICAGGHQCLAAGHF